MQNTSAATSTFTSTGNTTPTSTFTSTGNTTPTTTNTDYTGRKEVIITYWPWMRIMGVLEDARLERIPWADAKQAWITDPRPYEDLLPRAPKMIKAPSAITPAAAVPVIKSISYDNTPAVNASWPWERSMWLREQLRLRKNNVTWAQVRYHWLTGREQNTVGEL